MGKQHGHRPEDGDGLLERQTGSKGLPAGRPSRSRSISISTVSRKSSPIAMRRTATASSAATSCSCWKATAISEVLGDIPGARLVPQDKIGLSAFKRNGFLDIQSDQMTIGWDGDALCRSSTFPASSLDGAAFVAACQKSKIERTARRGRSRARERAIANASSTGFRRSASRRPTSTVCGLAGREFRLSHGRQGECLAGRCQECRRTSATGCDVASGKSQWPPAYFNHGDQPQQKLDFDGFLDACPARISSSPTTRSARRTARSALCGCLAREMPTQGVSQAGLDLWRSIIATRFPTLISRHRMPTS